jgi:hypothetical protein
MERSFGDPNGPGSSQGIAFLDDDAEDALPAEIGHA